MGAGGRTAPAERDVAGEKSRVLGFEAARVAKVASTRSFLVVLGQLFYVGRLSECPNGPFDVTLGTFSQLAATRNAPMRRFGSNSINCFAQNLPL